MERVNALLPEYNKENKFKKQVRLHTMIIYYQDINEMLDITAGLVQRGLTFEVHAMTCKIVLTGGY